MELSIFKYLDIIFTLITIVLYVAFLFCAENLNSKFLIFFISSFVNISCYSAVLKNEYNFFLIVLLNIMVMLVVVFYYFIIELNETLLPVEFVSRGLIKYIVIIFSFLFSFYSLSNISFSFFRKRNLITSNKVSGLIQSLNIKSNNFEKKISNVYNIDNGIRLYKKNIEILNYKMFNNYNVIILIYMIALNLFYFLLRDKEKVDFFKTEEEEEFLKEKKAEFDSSRKAKRKVRRKIGEEYKGENVGGEI